MTDARGLIDTSVLIDLPSIPASLLPTEMAVSAISFAELAAGPHAASDVRERARRQEQLQRLEADFAPLVFGADAARAFGRVFAATVAAGRQPRRRVADLFIAATALAERLPLYTRNPADFVGLEGLVRIVTV